MLSINIDLRMPQALSTSTHCNTGARFSVLKYSIKAPAVVLHRPCFYCIVSVVYHLWNFLSAVCHRVVTQGIIYNPTFDNLCCI